MSMTENDILEALNLWNITYFKLYNNENFPSFLPEGNKNIEKYLKEQIDKGNSIVIRNSNNSIIGYFSWIYIDFHCEKTVLCQTIGHCAQEEEKQFIYLQLYNYASREWVKNNVFNHLWMIPYNDKNLRELSFNLGFGSYVGDACIKIDTWNEFNDCYEITEATENDCELLFNLIEESRKYYLESPIFLKRKTETIEEIMKDINNEIAYLAWEKKDLIGFIHMKKNENYHIEKLSVPDSGYLGIYIKEKYRGKGLGKALLNKTFKYCKENFIKYAHVSFETSNINANKFWTKNLTPIVLSVRRTVNKDV